MVAAEITFCPVVLLSNEDENIPMLFYFSRKQQSLQLPRYENFLYTHQLLQYCCPLRLNCCSVGLT